MRIGVVVPTIREACLDSFLNAWLPIFAKHQVQLIVIKDGDDPQLWSANLSYRGSPASLGRATTLSKEKEICDLITPRNPAVRNFGFWWLAKAINKEPCDVIMTFDDDCRPVQDTIQHHLDALQFREPMSWFSPTTEFMRGFPWGIRDEAEPVISHGVWSGIPDYDAITQLQIETAVDRRMTKPSYGIYQGPIPRGVLYPHCGMNVAFRREILPHYYHAPVATLKGAERFDDIWMGIRLKRFIDTVLPWCVVTGGACVEHIRASDVFKNLEREAVGIGINERIWRENFDPSKESAEFQAFWNDYNTKAEAYKTLIESYL